MERGSREIEKRGNGREGVERVEREWKNEFQIVFKSN